LRPLSTQAVSDPPQAPSEPAGFEAFVLATEPALRGALMAAYGYEDGREAAAEALAYAWEHWAEVRQMPNAAGYLFRVAQSSAARRRRWRRPVPLPPVPPGTEHRFEPGLPAALAALSERQRVAVVLVHGFGCTLREVADLTGVTIATVQVHLERGLRRLRDRLGVVPDETTQRGGNDERH
jgi:DNA-directed RNA polymerase specialized sigma24 family protein